MSESHVPEVPSYVPDELAEWYGTSRRRTRGVARPARRRHLMPTDEHADMWLLGLAMSCCLAVLVGILVAVVLAAPDPVAAAVGLLALAAIAAIVGLLFARRLLRADRTGHTGGGP